VSVPGLQPVRPSRRVQAPFSTFEIQSGLVIDSDGSFNDPDRQFVNLLPDAKRLVFMGSDSLHQCEGANRRHYQFEDCGLHNRSLSQVRAEITGTKKLNKSLDNNRSASHDDSFVVFHTGECIDSFIYMEKAKTALLSQEGSVIAKQSREGWFQSRILAGISLEPPRRFAPPLLTQEGSTRSSICIYTSDDNH
jgi:hypothetical protein